MNMASHNPSGSPRQIEPSANRLDRLAVPSDDEITQMSSAGHGREERDSENPRSSRAFNDDCADLVHELANTTTAVLMNAQVLRWKLPPYSHLKRPLREIERNAQRGGELMRQLLGRLALTDDTKDTTAPTSPDSPCGQSHGLGLSDTLTAQEPGVDSRSAENLPPWRTSRPAPGLSSSGIAHGIHSSPSVEPAGMSIAGRETELTSPCDACTSTFPKKG